MPVEKVQLGVVAIAELLNNGYTWLKKDDLGFGSIQEKYQASDVQIATIRKHPALKDLETTARIFVIVDDRTNGTTTTSVSDTKRQDEELVASLRKSEPISTDTGTGLPEISDRVVTEGASEVDSFSAFANL